MQTEEEKVLAHLIKKTLVNFLNDYYIAGLNSWKKYSVKVLGHGNFLEVFLEPMKIL